MMGVKNWVIKNFLEVLLSLILAILVCFIFLQLKIFDAEVIVEYQTLKSPAPIAIFVIIYWSIRDSCPISSRD
jgi:hypothetical protein